MKPADTAQLLRTARTAIQAKDYFTAVDAMHQLVALDRQSGNVEMEILHLSNLAMLQNRLGLSEEALENLQGALVLARQQENLASEEGLLGNIGNILRELGQPIAAATHLQQALMLARQLKDRRGEGNWLSHLGLLHDDLAEYITAAEHHAGAVRIARQLGDQRGLAMRLGNLGITLMHIGQILPAIEAFTESIDIHRQLADTPTIAIRLGLLGNLYAELAASQTQPTDQEAYAVQALSAYREALHLLRDLQDPYGEATLRYSMGSVYAQLGNYADAIQCLLASINLYEQLHLPDMAQMAQQTLDRVRQLRDDTR